MTGTSQLSIYEKAFAKSDKTDAILVVDGKKLHVKKAKNAENLLKLADRFLMSSSKLIVINLIKTSTEFERFEKLCLADKYKLEDLLKYTVGLYFNKECFYDFYRWSDRVKEELSHETQSKLFQRYFFFGFGN
ncbi:hypothetical protein CAEBREN_08441 [Caenorhabditis brenneri]|uniref:BTB domain-containing protein n=1 Tax=Caenorhabditis brenneri TaxID=135651 RepID=G0MVZ3_CAEBE|nr:hypothetical protein CAEBREN_08441 [Caenorhabditis brenneri]